jgi:hypothetical protein
MVYSRVSKPAGGEAPPTPGFFYLYPMQKITFYGWHVGMRKVPFTFLLRDEAGLGIKEAHEATIRVLNEEAVTLEVPDELATRLLTQAEALGVRCRWEP